MALKTAKSTSLSRPDRYVMRPMIPTAITARITARIPIVVVAPATGLRRSFLTASVSITFRPGIAARGTPRVMIADASGASP